MAYTKERTVALKDSASLVPGNLSVLHGADEGGRTFAVIHKTRATIAHVLRDETRQEYVSFSNSERDGSLRHLTNVKWCHLKSSRVVLVVTSYVGFKITSLDGSDTLYENIFESSKELSTQRFARGVTSVDDYVCIGTSEGNILVFFVPPSGSNVVFSKQLQGHSVAITDISSCGEYQIASSDESGMIIIWANPENSAESTFVINEPGGVPCLSLCSWGYMVVGGFSNGMIKIFSHQTGRKLVEIAAHTRYITAMDVAQESGLLLSASEDCSAVVWTLPTDSHPKVEQVYHVHVADSLLCGAKFCDPQGSRFALIAFDSTTIIILKKTQQ